MRYAGARCWGLVSESLGGRFGKAVRTAQGAWRLSSRRWSHCPALVSWMVDGRAGTVCSVCAVCSTLNAQSPDVKRSYLSPINARGIPSECLGREPTQPASTCLPVSCTELEEGPASDSERIYTSARLVFANNPEYRVSLVPWIIKLTGRIEGVLFAAREQQTASCRPVQWCELSYPARN